MADLKPEITAILSFIFLLIGLNLVNNIYKLKKITFTNFFMINQEIINFANLLADTASEISKKYYRLANGEVAKEDDSPVTIADREIEQKIRELIFEKYPDHGIIGEEYGNHQEHRDYTWIIDPIDGTSSFIVGRPIFGNLIALTFKQKVILGIINQPINNERWLGIEGQGSWFNGQKISTRNCQKINDAVLSSSSPYFFKDQNKIIFEEICKHTKYQKIGGVVYGGDCYAYGCLASGFVDLIIEPELKIYDFASHIPIIKNAGGVITDWAGNDLKLESNTKLIASSTPKLHDEVLKIIEKIKTKIN
jgi:inositol-phosphate phosphatase/L-galactose 1-phosphate phosphatase/histidinol-phosphatase